MKLLQLRFGPVPDSVAERVRNLHDRAELDQLIERILTASCLQELGLI